MSSSTVDDPLLDEELALLGAPWAKEGMISRKSYLDADGKRARDKNWHNLFTVVQKGNIQMYTFENTSSSVNKSSVGGGNWLVRTRVFRVLVALSVRLTTVFASVSWSVQRTTGR